MPNRIINGESVWASDKIAACATPVPATTGVYYTWFYCLADVNGSFECTSTRVIHGKIAMQLPFLSLENTEQILHDFHREGLLFVWTTDGKRYGHWSKSEEKSAMPKSLKKRYKPAAPPVPQKEYSEYLKNYASQSPVFVRVSIDSRVSHDVVLTESRVNHDAVLHGSMRRHEKTLLGVGLGVGVGLGFNSLHPDGISRVQTPGENLVQQKPLDASERPQFDQFWEAYPRKEHKPAARKALAALQNLNGHFADLLAGLEVWKRSEQWQTERFIPLPEKWLANRGWEDRPARIAVMPESKVGLWDGKVEKPLTREDLGKPPDGFDWEEFTGDGHSVITGYLVCLKCKRKRIGGNKTAAKYHTKHECPKVAK